MTPAARRLIRPAQWASLAFLLLPGAAFGVGLLILGVEGAASHVALIGLAGGLATAAGIADWWYHATGRRVIGPVERRTELLALGAGGVPLFVLMGCASVVPAPAALLVPVLAIVVAIAVLIVVDERRFHVRCGALETLFHRVLVGGMAVAWMAWAHWCFVERVAVA